jgi:hypothetical protein
MFSHRGRVLKFNILRILVLILGPFLLWGSLRVWIPRSTNRCVTLHLLLEAGISHTGSMAIRYAQFARHLVPVNLFSGFSDVWMSRDRGSGNSSEHYNVMIDEHY